MGLVGRPGLVLSLVFLGGLASPAAAQVVPTAITFDILHAECSGAGVHHFTLSMNGHVLGSVPSGSVCYCEGSRASMTFSDAATLALFDPSGCNSFSVTVSPSASYVAEVEVTVATATDPVQYCLFDGYPGNPNRVCSHQRFCDTTGWSYLALVGGADPDGDGIAGGLGMGCDNCDRTANVDQTDSDADGFGNACDTCVGPGPVDSDEDLVCEAADNCPLAYNPGQEDTNHDGYGDVCQCLADPEICEEPADPCQQAYCSPSEGCTTVPRVCDDQSACTVDSCDSSGCMYNPVNGDDYNPCTFDYCDPLTGIVNEPISGGTCDDYNGCTTADTCYNGYCMGTPDDGAPCTDGNPCTADACSDGACAGTPVGAPSEVAHLRFPFSTLFNWDAVGQPDAESVYDVVRGTSSFDPTTVSETCLASGIPNLAFIDDLAPAPGAGLWYLVRARNSCGIGTFGAASNGRPRNVQGCP